MEMVLNCIFFPLIRLIAGNSAVVLVPQVLTYTGAGLAITVGVVCSRHSYISLVVIEQSVQICAYGIYFGADQLHRSGRNSFRALGGIPHNQYGLAKRGRLFLDST